MVQARSRGHDTVRTRLAGGIASPPRQGPTEQWHVNERGWFGRFGLPS